jgi:hypothetical protein
VYAQILRQILTIMPLRIAGCPSSRAKARRTFDAAWAR